MANNSDWLTVNPLQGSGDAALSITALANSGDIRYSTITVKNTQYGITKTINVTQYAYIPPVGPSRITYTTNTGNPINLNTETYKFWGANVTANTYDSIGHIDFDGPINRFYQDWLYTEEEIITSINIPEGVKYMATNSLGSCSALTSITLPDSLEYMGDVLWNAKGINFKVPSSLKYLESLMGELKGEIYDGIYYIGSPENNIYIAACVVDDTQSSYTLRPGTRFIDGTFQDCTALTSITLPEGLLMIGSGAFAGCTNLRDINIPSTVLHIGTEAFTACPNLPVENDVRYAGNSSNGIYCALLYNVNITPSNFKTGTKFIQRQNGNTYAKIGSFPVTSVVELGPFTYAGLSISDSTIRVLSSGTFKTIGKGAFQYCRGLTTITIPGDVELICDGAFEGCTALTTVEIGQSVKYIERLAFGNCYSLNTIISYATTAPLITRFTFVAIPSPGTLYIPRGADYSEWLHHLVNWRVQYLN